MIDTNFALKEITYHIEHDHGSDYAIWRVITWVYLPRMRTLYEREFQGRYTQRSSAKTRMAQLISRDTLVRKK